MAHRLSTHPEEPVIVVRDVAARPAAGVVAAAVHGPWDLDWVRFAAAEARLRQASLRLIAVRTALRNLGGAMLTARSPRSLLEEHATRLSDLAERVGREFPELTVGTRVMEADSGDALVALTEQVGLLAVGHRVTKRLGSPSGQVLHVLLRLAVRGSWPGRVRPGARQLAVRPPTPPGRAGVMAGARWEAAATTGRAAGTTKATDRPSGRDADRDGAHGRTGAAMASDHTDRPGDQGGIGGDRGCRAAAGARRRPSADRSAGKGRRRCGRCTPHLPRDRPGMARQPRRRRVAGPVPAWPQRH
ncbi:hypothetical protein ACFRI7_07515 [Streptomyces sp. NPDC056716]|uniref:hypothetical protein n=1 Tax=unclassified Streptomyces TaxID=2593676 RepID=UPI0036A1FB97